MLVKILSPNHRGLDNAGKTTIVKQIMMEDVTTVSPTLGFIIKTIDFQGYLASCFKLESSKLLIASMQIQTQYL